MKFELEDTFRGASDEELLNELRRCAKAIGRNTVTRAQFEEHGKCHPDTIARRFGSWTDALALAGLQPSRSKIGIKNEELFENLKAIWLSLGRQPRYSELKSHGSQYSVGTYENRFGSWQMALRAFVEWVNADDSKGPVDDAESQAESIGDQSKKAPKVKKRTRREISERQRFRILLRDGFRCLSCGASPIKQPGIDLHVDHILPWSKGGETKDENLQCKCSKCNLGKGNAFTACTPRLPQLKPSARPDTIPSTLSGGLGQSQLVCSILGTYPHLSTS